MKTIRLCPGCGSPLPPDAPMGLCPRCLMKDDSAETSEGGSASTATLSERPVPIPGQMFGRYRILRLLGQGGMGEVYEAEQVETGRRLALKVMGHALVSEQDRKRFLREGRLAASVNHPNVVYIHGSEEIAGAPVIAMELIQGGTLKERLKHEGPLPPAQAVEAALQIIAGLEAAQNVGVLHRDIKPANCYVDADGTVKVGDFGLSVSTLARGESLLTATGSVLGTPAYASPEQLRGEALDATSDIYSVGATLYHLLTGRTPFGAADFVKLITEVLDKQPEAPNEVRSDIPAGLSRVVMRCLAKERRARYQTYDDLRQALLPFGAAEAVPAPPARRFLAGVLDQFLAYGPSFLFVAYWQLDPLESLLRERTLHSALVWLPFFLWYLLYFSIAEGHSGAAVGKMICGLRVVGPDGQAPGLARGFWRTGIYLAPAILPYFVFMTLVPLAKMDAVLDSGEIVTDCVAGLLGLLLFVTMRRRNGYAAVQDLWSGTRVIVWPKSLPRPALAPLTTAPTLAPTTGPAAATAGSAGLSSFTFGPYQINGSLWKTVDEELLRAFDTILRRQVWIHLRAATAEPVSAARRDLNRPARLRWLNGGRTDGQIWDAYQACDGAPLLALAEQPRAWSSVRFWLLDLAEEMSAALKSGIAAPTLALDRVWVTANGRALLLDFGWPGLRVEPDAGGPIPLNGVAEMQAFLDLVAREGLVERSAGIIQDFKASGSERAQAGEEPKPFRWFRTVVPLHAHSFLLSLAQRAFEQPEFIVGNLRSLVTKPGQVTGAWRGASLAMIPLLVLGVALLVVATINLENTRWRRQWTSLYPGKPDLRPAAQLYHRAMEQKSTGAQRTAELTRAYLVNHFGPLLTNDTFWANHTLTGDFDEADQLLLRQAVTGYPAPTPKTVKEAETALAPYIQPQPGETIATVSVIVLVFGAAVFSLIEFFGCLLFGQSPILRLFGIAVVSRRGWPSTRARLLWRWALVWVPFGALGVIAATLLAIHYGTDWKTAPGDPAVDRVVCVLGMTVLAITTLAFSTGLWYAAAHPEKSLADRLAGTRLAPR
jgi:uncharacterized RDD family membrane protein YckC